MASKIRDIMKECQTGNHSHGSLIKSLTKVYHAIDIEEFFNEFVACLKRFLIVFKREPAVERAIDFICKFSASLRTQNKPEQEGEKEEKEAKEDDQDMHPFLLKLFQVLLQHHKARDKAVRFRCCHLVNKLLCEMGDEAQIDDELYEKIYNSMLIRLRDKYPVVRTHAVLALSRLQDPTDKDCPIITAYMYLLNRDQNPDVRRAVLSSIAATTRTLPSLLERTQDTKPSVRRLAYQVLAEKVHIRALTIAQRVKLLQRGLNDRTDVVKESCITKLLQAWLRIFSGNTLELLNCLDVENSVEVCQQMLEVLFKKASSEELSTGFDLLTEELCIPFEKLTCESALYWRCLCEHLRSLGVGEEEHLDKVLPNCVVYAKYIRSVVEQMKGADQLVTQLRNEFILQQLIFLIGVLDLSDEVGRKNVDKLIRELLLEDMVSHTVVKSLLSRYSYLHADPDACILSLAEIISDIREPISAVESQMSKEDKRQIELKLASLSVQLNQLREELDDSVTNQDFSRAAEIKEQIMNLENTKQTIFEDARTEVAEVRTEKNDSQTLLKCLSIVCEMLTEVRFKKLVPSLLSIMETLILPGIQNADPAVRNLAVKGLGLCCLRSVDRAKDYLILFLQISRMDVEAVRVTAIRTTFDLLLFYGLNVFNINPEVTDKTAAAASGESKGVNTSDMSEDDFESSGEKLSEPSPEATDFGASVLSILADFLDSDSSDIRTVCAEGFAKLLLAGRVISPSLLSRLLLHWYNPVTEDDTRLRHCLGTFLPIYAYALRANQEVISEAFMPTLRTLLFAPASSPLSEVKVANVSELLVHLSNARHLLAKDQSSGNLSDHCPHDDIAIQVANEILSEPDSTDIKIFVKILSMLELSPTNENTLKDLKVLGRRMLKEVKDKQCSKTLEKFLRNVKDMLVRLKENTGTEESKMEKADESKSESEDDEEQTTVAESRTLVTEDSTLATQSAVEQPSIVSNVKPRKGPAKKKKLLKKPVTKSSKCADDDLDDFCEKDKSHNDDDDDDDAFQSPVPSKARKARSRNAKSAAIEATKKNLKAALESESESGDDDDTLVAD